MTTLIESSASDGASSRMLDATPDALVIADVEGKIRLVNAQAEALFGYQRSELLGQPVEILIPERLRRAHAANRLSFAAHPQVRAMGSGLELFGRKRDGREFPVEISLSPLETEAGRFVLSAIRDVTERKNVELATRLAEEHSRLLSQRLLSAVESIQGMFAVFDAADRVVLCNSSFRQFFALAISGPIVGLSFVQLVDAALGCDLFELGSDDAGAFRVRWIAHHEDPSGSFDLRTRDGHTLRVADRPTPEGGIVKTIWDITDDVNRAEELSRTHLRAEQASLAKSEFLASMSHELRTPLNAILGFAQLLQRDKKTPLTDRQRDKVAHILRGGEHLLRLIDDVLDLVRIEAGSVTISLEPVSLADVLRDVCTTLEPLALRPGTELQVEALPSEDIQVQADRTRFGQVLINFGSNAIKYGCSAGHVRFVVTRPSGNSVRISVIDNGHGIALEKQHKLFEPFQRAGQELGPIEGTGIGLMICKRLATSMGGTVGFASEAGIGSEFWIELPEYRGAATAIATVRAEVARIPEQPGTRRVVVYIEDNPSNIAFMNDVVEELDNVLLLTAPTAEIGIELVKVRRPDLVIMDINLPGMNGIEATEKLREWSETRDIPVIALTAAAMMRESMRNDLGVFDRYLTKPVKVDELVRTLEEVFAAKKLAAQVP